MKQGLLTVGVGSGLSLGQEPRRTVVLTFDDAVKSHRTFVAPLLADLGFQATFFVTHRWMSDTENFMNWHEIAEIHQMGFEIGNHSWTHADFSLPKNAARFAGELALVDYQLNKVEVPKPISLAYSGNSFGPEALKVAREGGYRFGRRGMQPEVAYGKLGIGPVFDPRRHDPLLVPTTADAYPDWTFEHFQRVLSERSEGIVVLQFHGVPDSTHPWVHTKPELFRRCMEHLKKENYQVLAMRDLEPFVDRERPPADPLRAARQPAHEGQNLEPPPEVVATRRDLDYWLANMLVDHRYTIGEAALVAGEEEIEIRRRAKTITPTPVIPGKLKIRPYPGGRHPRIEFQNGAVDPLRGTKASVFLPWDPQQYIVVDLPEVMFTEDRRLFLAHTYIPTMWDDRNVVIENIDWERLPDGGLQSRRELPNRVSFGASIQPMERRLEMELWLTNGADAPLSSLRGQVCVMLKGATEWNELTMDNKVFHPPVAATRSRSGDRWVLIAWEKVGRCWGTSRCPCFHSDPVFPDCPPGQTVRSKGRLWFYEGSDIEGEIERWSI